MSTEKDRLIQIARKLSDAAGETYRGRWCFFAGFAFVLDGVEKVTHDIDVLTRDQKTFQHITEVLHQIGMKPAATTENFSSFKASWSGHLKDNDLTLDLLCIESEWLKPLKGIWAALEEKKVNGSRLPVAGPVHLILLKVLVNKHRQAYDRKKERDLVDVGRLMSIRGITPEQIRDEAKRQGLRGITEEFLKKIRTSS